MVNHDDASSVSETGFILSDWYHSRTNNIQMLDLAHTYLLFICVEHTVLCIHVCVCVFVCADLVEVVVFLRFEQMEGLPLLFTGSGQQVVEHMVVPADTHAHTHVHKHAHTHTHTHACKTS